MTIRVGIQNTGKRKVELKKPPVLIVKNVVIIEEPETIQAQEQKMTCYSFEWESPKLFNIGERIELTYFTEYPHRWIGSQEKLQYAFHVLTPNSGLYFVRFEVESPNEGDTERMVPTYFDDYVWVE
jgi:hypothetical protein